MDDLLFKQLVINMITSLLNNPNELTSSELKRLIILFKNNKFFLNTLTSILESYPQFDQINNIIILL